MRFASVTSATVCCAQFLTRAALGRPHTHVVAHERHACATPPRTEFDGQRVILPFRCPSPNARPWRPGCLDNCWFANWPGASWVQSESGPHGRKAGRGWRGRRQMTMSLWQLQNEGVLRPPAGPPELAQRPAPGSATQVSTARFCAPAGASGDAEGEDQGWGAERGLQLPRSSSTVTWQVTSSPWPPPTCCNTRFQIFLTSWNFLLAVFCRSKPIDVLCESFYGRLLPFVIGQYEAVE